MVIEVSRPKIEPMMTPVTHFDIGRSINRQKLNKSRRVRYKNKSPNDIKEV